MGPSMHLFCNSGEDVQCVFKIDCTGVGPDAQHEGSSVFRARPYDYYNTDNTRVTGDYYTGSTCGEDHPPKVPSPRSHLERSQSRPHGCIGCNLVQIFAEYMLAECRNALAAAGVGTRV